MDNNSIIKPIYFTKKWRVVPFDYEIWLPVTLEGVVQDYYFVSNLGRVQNIKGQFLQPQMINTGYLVYKLYTGNKYTKKYKAVLVHRLVMMTFHPIPSSELYTINHEDLDITNNKDENLSYMTQFENNEHKQINLLQFGTRNYQAMFSFDQLKVIKECLDSNVPYKDILARIGIPDSKVNRDYIGNIKRGITYKYEMSLLSKSV